MKPILIVDDNDMIVELISDIAQNNGIRSDHAATGEAALLLASCTQYATIFMDLNLDGMCGVETAIAIRELGEPYKSVPIVALTGLMPVAGMLRWNEADFIDTLVKPFSIRHLTTIMKKYVLGTE